MNLSSSAEAISAQLQKLAQRQKALEERRRVHEIEAQTIEIEEHEIQTLLATVVGRFSGQAGMKRQPKDGKQPSQPPPGAQLQEIVRILGEEGKLTRPELFEKLKPTGKQPGDLKQLSSLLTRLKNSGYVGFDQDHHWYATYTPT